MAIGKAAVIGAVAAVAIPYAAGTEGQIAHWVNRGIVVLPFGPNLHWSWMIFAIVTLFAWAMLAWANR
jgi:hypothetical protein